MGLRLRLGLGNPFLLGLLVVPLSCELATVYVWPLFSSPYSFLLPNNYIFPRRFLYYTLSFYGLHQFFTSFIKFRFKKSCVKLITISTKPINFRKLINLDSCLEFPLRIVQAFTLIVHFVKPTFEEAYTRFIINA